jgi:antirestriction protein ArdC
MGIETRTSFRNSAAYIQGWSKALKDDKEAIIRATAKAEAAYNLIMGITDDEQEEA